MSLTRREYLALFNYAASSYTYTKSPKIKENMTKIMDLVESVIGQQLRPQDVHNARKYLKGNPHPFRERL